MGKPTGFLEYKRKEEPILPVEERLKGFQEFHTDLDENERREQGARCMNCGVPFCQSALKLKGMVTGCPLHNLIPEWNDEIYRGHYKSALFRLLKTSNFPEFTGRVCPALCEKACLNGVDGESVTIHDNERFLVEKGFEEGWIKPRIPAIRSGKHVAVVGSGPSGLACADQLNHRGHEVTVFEREDRVGGLLMYGIPNMKLDKSIVERRRKLMEDEGVIFKTGVNVGKDMSASQLLKEYDAVVLACGAKKARGLSVENMKPEELSKVGGIYYAVDFLKSNTKALLQSAAKAGVKGEIPADIRPQEGSFVSAHCKHVVIVGGGDTGNDCLGTCIRQGAKNVIQLEMMPKPPVDRLPSNPWPEWPKVLKTDYGQQEAIARFGADPRIYETTIKEIHTDKTGNLKEIVTSKCTFKDRKLVLVPGTEKTIKCELLLIAAGFVGCEDYVTDAFSLARTQRGTAQTEADHYTAEGNKKQKTPLDGVFTCGDMHRGQSLVVWAVTEGRACAKEVDQYLMGYTNL